MRTEVFDTATLYLGDCREVVLTLSGVDAVVTDPPYGMGWNTNSERFNGGHGESKTGKGRGRSDWGSIASDNQALLNELPKNDELSVAPITASATIKRQRGDQTRPGPHLPAARHRTGGLPRTE